MSRADVPTGLTSSQAGLVHDLAVEIDRHIPRGKFVTSEHGREVTDYPFADISESTRRKLQCAGLLEREYRRTPSNQRDGNGTCIWELSDAAHERAAEWAATINSPCGCGHSGIRNLGDGEYTCTTDDCDVRVSREVVEG